MGEKKEKGKKGRRDRTWAKPTEIGLRNKRAREKDKKKKKKEWLSPESNHNPLKPRDSG